MRSSVGWPASEVDVDAESRAPVMSAVVRIVAPSIIDMAIIVGIEPPTVVPSAIVTSAIPAPAIIPMAVSPVVLPTIVASAPTPVHFVYYRRCSLWLH